MKQTLTLNTNEYGSEKESNVRHGPAIPKASMRYRGIINIPHIPTAAMISALKLVDLYDARRT